MKRYYYPWRKARIRKRLLKRDGPFCRYCTVELNETIGHPRQLTLDHVVPRTRGGRWRLSNIVLACATCNRRKGAMSAEQYLDTTLLKARRESVMLEQLPPPCACGASSGYRLDVVCPVHDA